MPGQEVQTVLAPEQFAACHVGRRAEHASVHGGLGVGRRGYCDGRKRAGDGAGAREQVIDARDAGRFTGETVDTVHGLPGGHIPGARNLFFRDLYNADGTFRSDDELRAAFERAGVDLSRPIVTSCGSGVTASVLLFALHRLGIEDAALYDGSWSEWGADPATPKETGAAA